MSRAPFACSESPVRAFSRILSTRVKRFPAWLLVVVAFAPASRVASAQSAKDATFATDVAPPAPIDVGQVVYPLGAHVDAAVVLEVTVDVEGRVTGARAIEGEDPFAAAALDAARAWTFLPARRAGRAVPARVRVRVDFHAPAALEPLAGAPSSAAGPAAARPRGAAGGGAGR